MQKTDFQIKRDATLLSIFSNTTLIILKVIAGIVCGSFSIISEAIHSMVDLLAAFIAFFAVKISSEPADEEHSFGHGKFEDFSGLIEGILIIFAALYIVYEAFKKIILGFHASINVDIAIYIMIFSIWVNIFVSKNLFSAAKKTGSIAVYSDAEHLRTDVYTSVGVLIGLFLIKVTNLPILDPVIALSVAILIWQAGFRICKKTVADLLDARLSKEEEKEILDTIYQIKTHQPYKVCKYKTRRSGVNKIIELTICVNGDMTVNESHQFCNEVEKILAEKIGNTDTIIHIEPLCDSCKNNLLEIN